MEPEKREESEIDTEPAKKTRVKVMQVRDWEENYEGHESKRYNNKTKCMMPCKHGLGYNRLIKHENGAALFGAWCALIQILSRHPAPRKGLIIDKGQKPETAENLSENPPYRVRTVCEPCAWCGYTVCDLEVLTGIPEHIFDELFEVAQVIGWLRVATFTVCEPCADRVRTVCGPCAYRALNLDSDSDYYRVGAGGGETPLASEEGLTTKLKRWRGVLAEGGLKVSALQLSNILTSYPKADPDRAVASAVIAAQSSEDEIRSHYGFLRSIFSADEVGRVKTENESEMNEALETDLDDLL